MKIRKLLSFIAFSLCFTVISYAQSNTLNVNDAIKEAASQFSSSIHKGTTVAILGISSSSKDLSEYMLDELTTNVVQMRKLQVVTRANLDIIKKEMDFQLTGEVSDETMQQLGAKTGAQTVISGTFKPLGKAFILNIQAFNVQTAAIEDVYRARVASDETIATLLGKGFTMAQNDEDEDEDDEPKGEYTAGERIGIGFQNILGGMGSYRNGHWGDGIFMSVLDATGIICIAYSSESVELAGTGALCIGTAIIYGFIRPIFYHREVQVAFDGKADGLNIGFAPPKSVYGGEFVPAASVSYKISW